MSEQFYAFLLRVYPSHIRSVYGDEALQRVRDRARHELSLRLWIDPLLDLVCSLPRLHLCPAPIAARVTAPAFLMLEGEAPRAESLFLGVVASLFLIGATIPIGHFLARTPTLTFGPEPLCKLSRKRPRNSPLPTAIALSRPWPPT
ncbi:MAG: hypothetical protein LAQ69_37340 [Acidobacteriia bacterium]|nr:hypothetical protein [Terriglobia bacterium]